MELNFIKYQGAGNDFVILNSLNNKISSELSQSQIATICDRNFGVGGDGMIIIAPSDSADFEMLYYNADGKLGSLCGNGSRCAVYYYYEWTGSKQTEIVFSSYDGIHKAQVVGEHTVKLQMADIDAYSHESNFYYMNTGSPHIVIFKEDIDALDMLQLGRQYRNLSPLKEAGSNVNVVQCGGKMSFVRTYERGVEGETLACGTGVTAAALLKSIHEKYKAGSYKEVFKALGGILSVYFLKTENGFQDIYLEGPAKRVFEGKIKI